MVGLHYGFTLYYLAQETRVFGLYWLPHYGSALNMRGQFMGASRMVNTGFVQLQGTIICLTDWDLKRFGAGTSGWASEQALQRRWWGWNPGGSWQYWNQWLPAWEANPTNLYLLPNRVLPPLSPDHPQYAMAQRLAESLD